MGSKISIKAPMQWVIPKEYVHAPNREVDVAKITEKTNRKHSENTLKTQRKKITEREKSSTMSIAITIGFSGLG